MNLAKSPKSILRTRRKSASPKLVDFLKNNTEGAAYIESFFLNWAIELLDSGNSRDPEKTDLLTRLITKIKPSYSLMANIINLFDLILVHLGNLDDLKSRLQSYREEIENQRQAATVTASKIILRHNSIFTLSNSSAIRNAILKANEQGWQGKVYMIESRPMNEGIIQAEAISQAGIKTVVGVDLMMREFIAKSDALFLGSDCVTETYFVNKVGSAVAVEIAKSEKKIVYVLTDKSKTISTRKYSFSPDNNPADEVYKSENKKIKVINQYFEAVRPSGRFHYICGAKVLLPSRMAKIISE
jgi:translation initiation factor 2B subunit (eIF-2B alpha/beta/delta family)